MDCREHLSKHDLHARRLPPGHACLIPHYVRVLELVEDTASAPLQSQELIRFVFEQESAMRATNTRILNKPSQVSICFSQRKSRGLDQHLLPMQRSVFRSHARTNELCYG